MNSYIRYISEPETQVLTYDNALQMLDNLECARIEYDPSVQLNSLIQEIERSSGRASDGFNTHYTIADEDADVQYISTASSTMYNDWLTRHFYETTHRSYQECVLDEDTLDEKANNELDDFLAEFAPKGET